MVDDGTSLSEARKIAVGLAAGPAIAIGLIRKQVAAALSATLEETMAIECANQDRAGRTADFGEAVRAFAEKRPPKFEGR